MLLFWPAILIQLSTVYGTNKALRENSNATMAVSVSACEKGGSNLEDVLKPFYKRASEAEDRLSRLEVALSSKKDSGNEELLKTVSELQSKLEGANTLLALKQEKVDKLVAENTKLNYRIIHLVRAVREADAKFESLKEKDPVGGDLDTE